MKLGAFEFSLRKAAEPATVPKQGLEIGDSGTRIFDGVVREEYNSKLDGTRGITVYDEMRKSDGTVSSAMKAVKLPIRAAEWYVTPGEADDDEAQKIADFVKACLFDYLKFADFLRQALLSLDYGVMVFEKVFELRDTEDGPRIVWKKLAPRMPRSIQKWAIAGGKPGIEQQRSDGKPVDIPMEKLIVFVNEMEGDNWWGTSLLRAAYKHWYMKSSLEKIDAIAHERQGLGVPKVKLPDAATKADSNKAEEIAKNMRANEHAYVVEPEGYDIGFMDMQANTTRDPANSLAYHSREIMKSVLAQFLELGSSTGAGASGSRAVSEDHSRLFLQSEESIARWICDVMVEPIKELVDLNFDGVTKYPCLDFEGITREDMKGLADTYSVLKIARVLTPQEADETAMREKMGLPALDEEGIREEPVPDDQDNPDFEASEHRHPKKKEFAGGPFKPFRRLTFAEGKVDFDAIRTRMDALEEQFDTETKALLHKARDEYMAAFTKAAHAGDTQAIKAATLKVQNDYERIIKNALKSAFEYGKNNAAKEIGVGAPPNPAEMLRQIDIQASAIANAQIAEITTDSKNAYVQALNKGESVSAALAAADAAAAAAIDALTDDARAILTSGYINHGRGVVFDRNAENIYALQRSEILDAVTCNYCLSIDGRIVEKDDSFAHNTIFHSNCRGIWVAIMQDEEERPSIGGIPQSLRDRFGDAVNDLLQPKKPIKRKS